MNTEFSRTKYKRRTTVERRITVENLMKAFQKKKHEREILNKLNQLKPEINK